MELTLINGYNQSEFLSDQMILFILEERRIQDYTVKLRFTSFHDNGDETTVVDQTAVDQTAVE